VIFFRGEHGSVQDENWTELFIKFKITELIKLFQIKLNRTIIIDTVEKNIKKIKRNRILVTKLFRIKPNCFEPNRIVSIQFHNC